MGNVVRLDEQQFFNLIKECVEETMDEIGNTPKGQFALNAVLGRATARMKKRRNKYGDSAEAEKQDKIASDAMDASYYSRSMADPMFKNRLMDFSSKSGYRYGFKKGENED